MLSCDCGNKFPYICKVAVLMCSFYAFLYCLICLCYQSKHGALLCCFICTLIGCICHTYHL
ncbi:hypothetical protein JOM56_001721 [Amanita muscaria]